MSLSLPEGIRGFNDAPRYKNYHPFFFNRIKNFKKKMKAFVINELKSPTTNLTVIRVLISRNLEVREISSNVIENILEFHDIFQYKKSSNPNNRTFIIFEIKDRKSVV